MKKKTICIVAVLSAFLMLMLPGVSAVNSRNVTETIDDVQPCIGGQTDGPSLFQVLFGIFWYGVLGKEFGEHPIIERIVFGNPNID